MEISVKVSDSVSTCNMTIYSKMTLSDLLTEVAETTRSSCIIHLLGYKALWCKKTGSKIEPHYLDSQTVLNDFFVSVCKFCKTLKSKKRVVRDSTVIIHNLGNSVSCTTCSLQFVSLFL